MRYALVRIWAVLTIGLLAGLLGDVGTEFSANFGWLGGTTRDVDHQGVLPVFAIAVLLALSLAAYIVSSRIAPGDPLDPLDDHVGCPSAAQVGVPEDGGQLADEAHQGEPLSKLRE